MFFDVVIAFSFVVALFSVCCNRCYFGVAIAPCSSLLQLVVGVGVSWRGVKVLGGPMRMGRGRFRVCEGGVSHCARNRGRVVLYLLSTFSFFSSPCEASAHLKAQRGHALTRHTSWCLRLGPQYTQNIALFRSKNFWDSDTITLSFLFDKYCTIIE